MKNDMEMIIKAKTTSDVEELDTLAKCFNYKIRRAVARNQFTSQKTLKILQEDSSMNVAYMANLNAKEKVIFKDSLSLENPCVICEKDESTFHHECNNCGNDSYSRIVEGYSPFGKDKIKYLK